MSTEKISTKGKTVYLVELYRLLGKNNTQTHNRRKYTRAKE